MHISADIHIEGKPVLRFNQGESAHWVEIRDSMDWHTNAAVVFAANVPPDVLERAAAAFNAVIQESQISQAAE